MIIEKIVFVGIGEKKRLQKEYPYGPNSQPAVVPEKNDIWSFNLQGDDLTRYVVESREFEETGEGHFEVVLGIRRVPRRRK